MGGGLNYIIQPHQIFHWTNGISAGPDASKQVRFKLNRKGGTLYLSKNGKDVDLTFSYPESVPRCSFARIRLDSDEWQYCGMPTPEKANEGVFAQESLPVPEVDCDSRLFTSGFDVYVQIPSGTTLRYTTDGSTPTLTNGTISTDGAFSVSKTTVLRLRLFSDDKLPSGVVTRTYIYKDRNYYPRYALLRQQLGYHYPEGGTDYVFYWMDPLYAPHDDSVTDPLCPY